MKTNIQIIQEVVDYIDSHLEDRLDSESISRQAGYSRYHLSRMFTSITGLSLHTYIQRRRLTEAAVHGPACHGHCPVRRVWQPASFYSGVQGAVQNQSQGIQEKGGLPSPAA